MPRDGAGIYHTPAGVHENAVAGNTIASNVYNLNVSDVETDLNTARPIVAGGTGATSPDNALNALGAEKNNQIVTNFDAQPWISGSFSAEPTVTGAPVAGHRWAGICYVKDAQTMVVEARDLSDGTDPGTLWVRKKYANAWGSWYKMEGAAASIDETRAGVDIDKRLTPYNHKYSHTPMFSATAGSQAAALNSWQALIGFSEQCDTDGTFNGVSFQPLAEGWYQVGGVIQMPTNGGTTGAALWVNGVASNYAVVQQGAGVSTTQIQVTGMLHLSGSDYVQLVGYCDYTPAPAFNTAGFWGFRIGPNF